MLELTFIVFVLIENSGVICPNCNVELDPKVHLFCYRCGKSTLECVPVVRKRQGKDVKHREQCDLRVRASVRLGKSPH